jgi:hypothetical protein
MKTSIQSPMGQQPWNKGRLVGQKAPLRLRDIWAIRVRLQLRHATRDLALFNLAIDSKLRACDSTSPMVSGYLNEQRFFSRRLSGRCSSRLRSRLVPRSAHGWPRHPYTKMHSCSQADFMARFTFQLASTHASLINGSWISAWMSPPTEPTR